MILRSSRIVEPSILPDSRKRKKSRVRFRGGIRKQTRPLRLSERNLRLFDGAMPNKRKTSGTDVSSRSTTTDKEFAAQLSRNGIRHVRVETKPPHDASSVRQYLSRSRESKSPDDADFKEYIAAVEYAGNEATMQSRSWHHLAKRPSYCHTPGYFDDFNFQWTEEEGSVREGISDPKPDISESYRTSQYPPAALDALGGALAPTLYNVAMPRLCVEFKGPDGTMDSAEKQSAYDGAVMTDAAFQAHTHLQKDPNDFYGRTQSITITSNGDLVRIYGNHVLQDERSPQYHQHPLYSHLPTESLHHFKDTRRHVRNAQDWARERAYATKDALNNDPRCNEVDDGVITPPSSSARAKGTGEGKMGRRGKAGRKV